MPSKPSGQQSPYLHPGAFAEARAAFAGEEVADLLARFEAESEELVGCSHLALAACLHHFLSVGPVDRQVLLVRYLDAVDPRRGRAAAARGPQAISPSGKDGRGHGPGRNDRRLLRLRLRLRVSPSRPSSAGRVTRERSNPAARTAGAPHRPGGVQHE